MKTEEIEEAVRALAKESTAPDKETPDWMEADIRRGIKWALDKNGEEILRLKQKIISKNETIINLRQEIDRITD